MSSPGATAAQKEWNKGKAGPTPARPTVPLTTVCPTDGCGAPTPPTADRGWTYTRVSGSADPGRWWCSGSCATTGIARAELRMEDPWPPSWS